MEIGGFSPAGFIYALTVVLAAAIVRGYTGFGFSALVVLSLSMLLPPAEVVPVVLLLEITASLRMLPSVWNHIDWKTLRWLLLGSAVSIPIGVTLLAIMPAAPMRAIISLLVLAASILIWFGFTVRSSDRPGLPLFTGVVSGAMTGAAAIGGLAVVVMFLSASVDMAIARATLVMLFLITDIYTSVLAGTQGLLSEETIIRYGIFLLPAVIGIAIGSRQFHRSNKQSFRKFTLVLLMVISVGGLVRAYMG